jgi:Arc/MetJ family transcription regulator
VYPKRHGVRLTVDGLVMERPLDIRMDPRVQADVDDIAAQTTLSMDCYRGHLRLQTLREALEAALRDGAADMPGERRTALERLRGPGLPGDPDLLYEHITAEPDTAETIVGLQHKLQFMLNLLQQADARPTRQAHAAVADLLKTASAIEARWRALQ